MAQQPGIFEMFWPTTGERFQVDEEAGEQALLALAAAAVAPTIRQLQTLDDPDEVARLVAEDIADRQGLDVERVRRCVFRLMSPRAGASVLRGTALIPAFLNGVPSLLRRAVNCMPTPAALRFCEEEDLSRFEDRDLVTHVLADQRSPLYSLDEFRMLLAKFTAHQETNRVPLATTGHPATAFAPSPWFDVHLNKLYFDKVPIVIDQTSVGTMPAAHPRYVDWRRISTTPTTYAARWVFNRFTDAELTGSVEPYPRCAFVWGKTVRGSVVACTYDEADLLDRIARSDIRWVAALRAKFADLKTRFLAQLHDGLRARDPEQLWERCLAILVEGLTADEAKNLLAIDLAYSGANACSPPAVPVELPLIPGGLTGLIEAAGFAEKELRVGTFARTRAELGELVSVDGMGRTHLLGSDCRDPYLTLVAQGHGDAVRRAADLFTRLDAEEAVFWSSFRKRVQDALAREFKIPLGIYVKATLEAPLRDLVNRDVQEIARKLELGTLIPSLEHEAAVAPPLPRNAIQREGMNWLIRFDGEVPFRLKDTTGLFCLHYLLTRPKTPCRVTTMRGDYLRYAATQNASKSVSGIGAVDAIVANLSAASSPDDGELTGPQAEKDYKARTRCIQEELKILAGTDELDRIEELTKERNFIAEELDRGRQPNGKWALVGVREQKDRKAVGNAIRRAIAAIRLNSTSLSHHLRKSLELGKFCVYRPVPPVVWNE